MSKLPSQKKVCSCGVVLSAPAVTSPLYAGREVHPGGIEVVPMGCDNCKHVAAELKCAACDGLGYVHVWPFGEPPIGDEKRERRVCNVCSSEVHARSRELPFEPKRVPDERRTPYPNLADAQDERAFRTWVNESLPELVESAVEVEQAQGFLTVEAGVKYAKAATLDGLALTVVRMSWE